MALVSDLHLQDVATDKFHQKLREVLGSVTRRITLPITTNHNFLVKKIFDKLSSLPGPLLLDCRDKVEPLHSVEGGGLNK